MSNPHGEKYRGDSNFRSPMSEPKIEFVYLLNRMENAASAKEPSKAGYGEHRKAVIEHVARVESELAEARAALREAVPYLRGMAEKLQIASNEPNVKLLNERIQRADAILAKQG